MSFILGDLEDLISNNPSSKLIEWTPKLIQSFETAKMEANHMDNVYLPKP